MTESGEEQTAGSGQEQMTGLIMKNGSVEGGGETGIAEMLEHVGDLARGDARERERREMIFGEELGASGFGAVLRGAATKISEEEDFVGVEGVRGMALLVAIEKGGKLGDADFIAGFFADFASSGDGGRLAHVGPAAGKSPAAVLKFADQEDAVVAKGSDADIDFGSSVAGLLSE